MKMMRARAAPFVAVLMAVILLLVTAVLPAAQARAVTTVEKTAVAANVTVQPTQVVVATDDGTSATYRQEAATINPYRLQTGRRLTRHPPSRGEHAAVANATYGMSACAHTDPDVGTVLRT